MLIKFTIPEWDAAIDAGRACPILCDNEACQRPATRYVAGLPMCDECEPRPPEHPCQDDGGIPVWADGLTECPQQAEPSPLSATVEALSTCDECWGRGQILIDCRWKKCLTCNGTGKAAG